MGGGEDISGGESTDSTDADDMRSGAVLAGAVLLATLNAILSSPEVGKNNLAQNSGRAVAAETVLTDEEKTLVKEETFLEKLFLEISPKKSIETIDGQESLLQLKSFLKTFKETPKLQRKGMSIYCLKLDEATCYSIWDISYTRLLLYMANISLNTH